MAMNDSIIGSQYGGSTGPRLVLDWEILNQEISNNRSRVRLTLKLVASHRVSFSTSKSGVLNGSSFNYTKGASGTGTWTLATRTFWVNHNSDGKKSISFSGSFNIAITFAGQRINTMSVSGTANLEEIPRASTIYNFYVQNDLEPNKSAEIYYNVTRKLGSYYHQIKFYEGGEEIIQWQNIDSDGPSSLIIPADKVNEILENNPNSTSLSFRLRIATRESYNGSFIGSADSKNATGKISDNVIPQANSVSPNISGNGIDKSAIGSYIQGKSRVNVSFSPVAGYGATVNTTQIIVRRKNDKADSQTISGNSGTTSRAVRLGGTYEVVAQVWDSRGRSNQSIRDITVEAYSKPRITNFKASRNTTNTNRVDVAFVTEWENLGEGNEITVRISRREKGGNWSNLVTRYDSSGSYADNYSNYSNSDLTSFEYRLSVSDLFQESTVAVVTVPTQKVVFDVHQNEGVGIGKFHERGELDVAGEAYFEGNIIMEPLPGAERPGLELISRDLNGHSYVEFYGSDKRRKGYIGIPTASRGDVEIGSDNDVTIKADRLRMNPGDASSFYDFWHDGNVERGRNSNGDWIKFPNGVMICYMFTSSPVSVPFSAWGGMYRGFIQDTFPQIFNEAPKVILEGKPGRDASMLMNSYMIDNITNSTVKVVALTNDSRSNKILERGYVAIGRWK